MGTLNEMGHEMSLSFRLLSVVGNCAKYGNKNKRISFSYSDVDFFLCLEISFCESKRLIRIQL